jgi:hypothetical protein
MKKTKLAAGILAGSLLLGAAPIPAATQDSGRDAGQGEKTADQAKGLGSLEKSLLIPGWGQISEKRWLEGAFFLAAEAFCIVQALRQNKLGNSAYLAYKSAGSLDDVVRLRQETEKRDSRRNQYLLAGAAVWALNLLDIHLIVRGKEGAAKELTLRFGHDATQAIVAVAGFRF